MRPEQSFQQQKNQEIVRSESEWQDIQDILEGVERTIRELGAQSRDVREQLRREPESIRLHHEIAEIETLLAEYRAGLTDLITREKELVEHDDDLAEMERLIEQRTAPGGRS